jgi:hypothetical protein
MVVSPPPAMALLWLRPDELTAVLAAEQRYLVEQVGSGSVRGETYVEKARERVRRGPALPS